MKWCLTSLFVVGFGLCAFCQPDVRLAYAVKLDVGANFAKFDDQRDLNVRQKMGSVLDLTAGLGIRYRERYGIFASGGGVLDSYAFQLDSGEYSVSSITWKMHLSAFALLPIKKNNHSDLHVGIDLGTVFYGPDTEGETIGNYSILASSFGPKSNILSPELGLVKSFPRGAMHFLLTYSYIFRDSATVNFAFTKDGVTNYARGKGDYVGLRFRYTGDITPPKPPKLKLPQPPAEMKNFMARETRVGRTYSVKRRVVKLRLWDQAELDGDSISVFFNDNFILVDHALTRKKKVIKLYLQDGTNTIMVCAKNEGTISPNTVACRLRVRGRKEDFVFSTSMDRNETLILNLD
ncbi:MAG: hypothetical protein GC193_08475 [Cryomorphaceae bacterium]|nr:hypothetical protein [Cryomorphaceae bacterium]